MALVEIGRTTHFVVRYDDSLSAAGQALARAQAVLATCEQDLMRCRGVLNYSTGGGGDPYIDGHRIDVQLVDLRGPLNQLANNHGEGGAVHPFYTIKVGVFNKAAGSISDDFARFLFVAELAEVLMNAYGWIPSDSSGEALSRILAEELYPKAAYGEGGAPWVTNWLNQSPRNFQYIANAEPTDANDISFGMAILFINYIRSQIGHSLVDIATNKGPQLVDCWRNLTKQQGDGVTDFRDLLEAHFPAGKALTLFTNNPFPLYDAGRRSAWLSFAEARDTTQPPFPVRAAGHRTTHVAPFPGCSERDYSYSVARHPRRLDCVARTEGFAMPVFQWRVNGVDLHGSSGNKTVTADVSVDVPSKPGMPTQSSEPFAFRFEIADTSSADGRQSTLSIFNISHSGSYKLAIDADVHERYGDATLTQAHGTSHVKASVVVYEDKFYADQASCAAKFALSKRLLSWTKVFKKTPHPNETLDLLGALADLREDMHTRNLSDSERSNVISVVAGSLGVPHDVVRRVLSGDVMADRN